MQENDVIDEILTGHTHQFALLVQAHNDLLYRIGMSYLNNHTEVEDLMQVTYLKAYEHLAQFNHQSSFSTWITRIMINECLMFLRKKKHGFQLTSAEQDTTALADIPDQSSLEATINYKQLKEVTERMLFQLPEEYRIIFILREVQKFSSKEVAEIVGITEESVRTRLMRAKKKLQRLVIDYMGESDIFSYDKKHCNPFTAKVMQQIYLRQL